MQKKAIEPIIATVLLIVIVIIAIALIIAFLVPFIQRQLQEAEITELCYKARVEIKEACFNVTDVIVRIGRGAEEFELNGIIVGASTETAKKSFTINKTLPEGLPGRLEETTYAIKLSEFGFSDGTTIKSVSIAPIVKRGITEKACDTTSQITVSRCAQ